MFGLDLLPIFVIFAVISMRLCPTFNSQTVRVSTNADNPIQPVGEDNLCLSDTAHDGWKG